MTLRTHPERLSSDRFMRSTEAIRVFRQDFVESVGVHWHEFYELNFTISGYGTHIVNGNHRTLSPGSVFLLTPADVHEIRPAGDQHLHGFNVIFEKQLLKVPVQPLLFGHASTGVTPWVVDDLHECAEDFSRLWQEAEEGEVGHELVMESALQCILVTLARRWSAERRDSPECCLDGQEPIRQALLYIDRHFREPLSLAEVAQQAYLSPNYFSERFHQVAGQSFQSYLQTRRLRFAHSLLAATTLPITEICHASGFNDLSHFGRAFKRHFGQSPSACRRTAVVEAVS